MTPNTARPWHTLEKLPVIMTQAVPLEVCNVHTTHRAIVIYGGGIDQHANLKRSYTHWKQAEPLPLLPEQ